MAINPYTFVKRNGLYTFYKNGTAVVEDILDPRIEKVVFKDEQGYECTRFYYFDEQLFLFMKKETQYEQPLSARYRSTYHTIYKASNDGEQKPTQPETPTDPKPQPEKPSPEKPTEPGKPEEKPEGKPEGKPETPQPPDGAKNHTEHKKTEQSDPKYDEACKKGDQAKASSDQAISGVLQTPQQGFGNVPDKSKVNELTQNTGMYGGGVTNLVYPSDLVTNQYGYNGCYTVLFITEHQDSTISKIKGATDVKYVETAIGSEVLEMAKKDPEFINTLTTLAGSVVGAGVATKVAQFLRVNKVAGAVGQVTTGGAKGAQLTAHAATVAGGAASGATSAAAEVNNELKQMKVAIALPTPAITDTHQLEWEAQNSMLGTGLMQAAVALKNTSIPATKFESGDGFLGFMTGAVNYLAERGQAIGGAIANETVQEGLGASAIHAMAQTGIGSSMLRLAGKAANTRKEMIFQDVALREFQMKFQMAARSPDDMKNIESIIRVLKYHAYPELTPNNFMWIYPALFDIVHYYRDGVNYHMPRHATSVLKSIAIDYSNGQGGVSVHHDGSPVMITLDLTFMEIAMLNRQSIAKGY